MNIVTIYVHLILFTKLGNQLEATATAGE